MGDIGKLSLNDAAANVRKDEGKRPATEAEIKAQRAREAAQTHSTQSAAHAHSEKLAAAVGALTVDGPAVLASSGDGALSADMKEAAAQLFSDIQLGARDARAVGEPGAGAQLLGHVDVAVAQQWSGPAFFAEAGVVVKAEQPDAHEHLSALKDALTLRDNRALKLLDKGTLSKQPLWRQFSQPAVKAFLKEVGTKLDYGTAAQAKTVASSSGATVISGEALASKHAATSPSVVRSSSKKTGPALDASQPAAARDEAATGNASSNVLSDADLKKLTDTIRIAMEGRDIDLSHVDIDEAIQMVMYQINEQAELELRDLMKDMEVRIKEKRIKRAEVQARQEQKTRADSLLMHEYQTLQAGKLIDPSVSFEDFKKQCKVSYGEPRVDKETGDVIAGGVALAEPIWSNQPGSIPDNMKPGATTKTNDKDDQGPSDALKKFGQSLGIPDADLNGVIATFVGDYEYTHKAATPSDPAKFQQALEAFLKSKGFTFPTNGAPLTDAQKAANAAKAKEMQGNYSTTESLAADLSQESGIAPEFLNTYIAMFVGEYEAKNGKAVPADAMQFKALLITYLKDKGFKMPADAAARTANATKAATSPENKDVFPLTDMCKKFGLDRDTMFALQGECMNEGFGKAKFEEWLTKFAGLIPGADNKARVAGLDLPAIRSRVTLQKKIDAAAAALNKFTDACKNHGDISGAGKELDHALAELQQASQANFGVNGDATSTSSWQSPKDLLNGFMLAVKAALSSVTDPAGKTAATQLMQMWPSANFHIGKGTDSGQHLYVPPPPKKADPVFRNVINPLATGAATDDKVGALPDAIMTSAQAAYNACKGPNDPDFATWAKQFKGDGKTIGAAMQKALTTLAKNKGDNANQFLTQFGQQLKAFEDGNYQPATAGYTEQKATPGHENCTTTAAMDDKIKKAKDELDTMGDTSELDQLKLQRLSDRRAKALETITNLMKKTAQTRDKIIENMK